MAYGSTVQLSPQEAQSLSSQVQGISPTTLSIFLNNARVALIEFIPFVGPAFAVYVSYSTGVALSAITQSSTSIHMSGLEAFFLLLVTPIYWMEFFSYSLAVEESIAIIVAIRKKEFLTKEWKWLLLSILIVVSVLFFSAKVESSLVGMFS